MEDRQRSCVSGLFGRSVIIIRMSGRCCSIRRAQILSDSWCLVLQPNQPLCSVHPGGRGGGAKTAPGGGGSADILGY